MIWTRELHEKFVRALNHLGPGSKNFFTNSTSIVCLFFFLFKKLYTHHYLQYHGSLCVFVCVCVVCLFFFWQRIMTKATTT
jgi:hypothetical protein